MEYSVRKVVITGGSGPIGLALIRKLLREDIEILLLQRSNSAKKIYLPKDRRLQIEDIALDGLKSYVPKSHDYDVFFHLGWTNTRKESRDDFEKQNENVVYACEAVELAYKLGCHSFIGAGSQAECGRHMEPLREDTLCTPETAYGVMKLSACYATRILCQRYGMRHIWSRILSGYGIYDNISSMLISNILNSINGRKLEFSKGEQIWDFVYLDDIANAFFLIAQKGKCNAIYPIGSGKARPLKEYIRILCQALGEEENAGLGSLPYAKNQVMYLAADIDKLQQDTGWMPKVEFEDGIAVVIEFYREWKIKWEKQYLELRKDVEGF